MDDYPQPWIRIYERPPVDFSETLLDPSTLAPFKEHVYEGYRDACGRMFYIPLHSDPKAAIAAAIDKYPAPPDHSKITVPVKMLYEALLQIGDPVPDFDKIHRIYSLVHEHYRNHPPE